MVFRLLLTALLVVGAMLPATAVAKTEDTTPCVPAADVPSSDNDQNWSVRVCDVPDFDQRREPANDLGQPTPITVAGLPGNGSCHCVLTSIADLYARAQAPLDGADDYATFDWAGRGALPAAPSGGAYDTSTYTAAEVEAYQDVTDVLGEFGSIADVSYGQDAAHSGCGTSWSKFYDNLPDVAEEFGDAADDYAIGAFGVDEGSAADMARALAFGSGVGFAYGYYDGVTVGQDGDTATKRSGGHANAIVGVSRSGDTYTFETADPASSAAAGTEDKVRQSQFSRTTWTATQRQLTVGADTNERFRLEETNRYVDSWLKFTPPGLVAKLKPNKLLVRPYVPPRDLPRPPFDVREQFAYPGPVLDAVQDQVATRVLALVDVGRAPKLFVADQFTGRTRALGADLPAGATRLAALPDGTTAVLGTKILRGFDGSGDTLVSRKIAGGGTDVALNPRTGGVTVLRADGQRLLRFSPGLAPAGSRGFDVRRRAAVGTRLSVAADGSVRPTRASSDRQVLLTPSGGRLVLAGGTAKVVESGRPVAGRRVVGLRRATLLDLSTGGILPEPPGGASETDLVDGRLARPVPGYAELSP